MLRIFPRQLGFDFGVMLAPEICQVLGDLDGFHAGGQNVDGDRDAADVVVFTTGKAVFAACVHGEGNDAARERAPMLAVLTTAKAP